MPPADYKGEDYQLDKAVELIHAGKAVATKAVASVPAAQASAPAGAAPTTP
jgi:hypothetical protein